MNLRALLFSSLNSTTSASPVWEELPPPFPSLIKFFARVASLLDGNVYAFGKLLNDHPTYPARFPPGKLLNHHPIDHYPDTYTGLVFDPSSRSWNPCPPPTLILIVVIDRSTINYAVVHIELVGLLSSITRGCQRLSILPLPNGKTPSQPIPLSLFGAVMMNVIELRLLWV